MGMFLILGANAKAETGWIATPFWTAPKSEKIELKLEAENMELLKKQCKELSDRLSYESLPLESKTFDRLRSRDSFSNTGMFKSVFYILNSPISLSTTEDIQTTKLPFYLQKNSLQQVVLDNTVKFSAMSTQGSYGAIAKSLGLSDTTAQFTKYRYRDAIEITGKDLACDLINQKAFLKSNVNSVVWIDGQNKNELEDLYINKVRTDINDAFNTEKNSPALKAAILGFKLGKTLSELNSSNNVEDELKNVFNLFFKGNLENTKYLIESQGSKEVLLPTSGQALVELNCKF